MIIKDIDNKFQNVGNKFQNENHICKKNREYKN